MFLLDTRAITVSVVQSCCPATTGDEEDKGYNSTDFRMPNYNYSQKVHPLPLLDPPAIRRRHIVIPIITPAPPNKGGLQRQDTASIRLTLDKDNSYTTGSTLTGTVHLQQPSAAAAFGEEGEEKSANSTYYEHDGAEVEGGTLSLALEGSESTTLSFGTRFKSKERVVYKDSYCFLRQEKKFPLYNSSSGGAVINFSLNIPHDLPEPIQSYRAYMKESTAGECALCYTLTAKWEPHQKQQDAGDDDPTVPPQQHSSRGVHIVAAKEQNSLHPPSPSSLALSVTSSVEIPSYFCGFLWVVSTRTTFVLNVDPTVDKLDLHPNQRLQIGMRDQVDCSTLGLKTQTPEGDDKGNNNNNNNKLVAKLTQRFQLLAREQPSSAANTRGGFSASSSSQHRDFHETPVQTETWDMDVATDGTITIPSNANKNTANKNRLLMSHTGLLIRVHHDLIAYVLDVKKKSILATTQPIPVILSS